MGKVRERRVIDVEEGEERCRRRKERKK